MSTRDTFGPRLRSERERRGISLETIALVTKVSVDLWEGLERNDFSRWPSGIFARAFVRDYARAVGLDADDVVDDFCRLFPVGDRRVSRVLKAQAELIGHGVSYAGEAILPPGGDRRASARERQERARAMRIRIAPRALAAGLDTACALLLGGGVAFLFGTPFWATTGAIAITYYGISTVAGASSPGLRAVDWLKPRLPALFPVQDRRRAHA
jgi:transcriptional regulator with XRE-family HTH domain